MQESNIAELGFKTFLGSLCLQNCVSLLDYFIFLLHFPIIEDIYSTEVYLELEELSKSKII